MNGKQFLEVLARLPARVWLQAILGLVGFVVLAVLGFAVIAGVAAIIVLAILAIKAKTWFHSQDLIAACHGHEILRFAQDDCIALSTTTGSRRLRSAGR